MSQDRLRKLKKGDVLLKEGEASEFLFLVQSGRLQAVIERGAKKFEMGQIKPQQVVGDNWILSPGKSPMTYVAQQETTVLEVPLTMLRTQFEQTSPGLKLVIKSMGEDLKSLRQGFKSEKMESDPTPMPLAQLARSLSLVHLCARHIGKMENDALMVDWNLFRQFLQKFFMEPSSRTKQWMMLFKKMGFVNFEIKTNEDGEEDLGKIQFSQIQVIEDFAEFYQHFYFKSPAHEMIHYDMIPAKAAKALAELGEGLPVDHRKATAVPMPALSEKFKSLARMEFKLNHFDHLERKGLFIKRVSQPDGQVLISFDHPEFKKVSLYWEILFEVDEWNKNGSVNMSVASAPESADGVAGCPSCSAPLSAGNKFCPECGFKLAA